MVVWKFCLGGFFEHSVFFSPRTLGKKTLQVDLHNLFSDGWEVQPTNQLWSWAMSPSKDLMGEGTSSICRKGVCLELGFPDGFFFMAFESTYPFPPPPQGDKALVVATQTFFIFTPNPWGNDPFWRAYFSHGLVQPPTSYKMGPPNYYKWIYP